MRGTRPTRAVRRRLIASAGFALTAVLAVFHGGLLWQRLSDGSLLQPVVVLRWVVSAVLLVALAQVWSRGLPLFRGRHAGVIWLIVALLHAFTPAGPLPAVEPVGEGLLPTVLALLSILALWAVATGSDTSSSLRRPDPRRRRPSRRASAGWYRVLFSRPPPALLHP